MPEVLNRPYKGNVKVVILDWAGTTMDFGCMAPAVVFMDVFKKHRVPITMEEARGPMGAHKRVHILKVSQNPAVAKRWEEVYGNPLDESDVDRMFADFIPMQLKVLAHYADLIPGTLEAVAEFRRMGLKIGSTTGYTSEMMEILYDEAKQRGYVPDSTVCAAEVPAGRPHPWMCLKNALILAIYPMEAYVKVGDTLPDIYEGLNAGMWTVGLAMTGNEIGLMEDELNRLDPAKREAMRQRAYQRMEEAGAHYVVDSISDVPPLIEKINSRLAQGEKP